MTEGDPVNIERKSKLLAVKAEVASYLKSSPSHDPKRVLSVVDFCKKGADLLVDAIASSWAIYNHQPEDVIRPVLIKVFDDKTAYEQGKDSQEQFWLDGGRIDIATPPDFRAGGSKDRMTFGGIITTAGYIDRGLPRFWYAWALSKPPIPLKNIRAQGPAKGISFYDNVRLAEFRRAGEFDPGAGETDLLTLIFLEQVAKDKAIHDIKFELKPFGNPKSSLMIYPPSEPVKAQEYLLRRLNETNYHLGYLSKVKQVQARVINTLGLDKEQVQIFYDIAFLRKGGLDSGELPQFIEPIMLTVGQGRYADAFQMRDFLISNFLGCFPTWKQTEHQEGMALEGVKDYLEHRAEENKPPLEGVPNDYREIIQAVLDKLTLKEEAREARRETWGERRKEESRKNILGATLLLYSLEVASRKLDENRGIKPRFNPSLPISASNPLYLNMVGSANLTYRSFLRSDEGKEVQFQIIYNLTSVFTNLLYRDLINAAAVHEAYAKLKQEGQLIDSDSAYDLLIRPLKKSLRSLTGRLHSPYNTSDKDVIAFTQMKVSKIVDLLEAVAS